MKTPEQIRARLDKAREEQKEAKMWYDSKPEPGPAYMYIVEERETNLTIINREVEVLEWMLSEE